MTLRVCALALSLSLLAPADVRGQQAAGSQPAQVPAIRTVTRLVQVSVIAKDRHGQPVEGLTKDDFLVYDKGEPKPIALFSMEKMSRSNPAPLVATADNVYTNRPKEPGGGPNSVTVILLDGLNTRVTDQAYARSEVIKFLSQIQPGDRVALYTLGSELQLLHDFTSDSQRLVEALNRYKVRGQVAFRASDPAIDPGSSGAGAGAASGSGLASNADAALDAFLNDANQQAAEFFRLNRARDTLQALLTIASHVSPLPGRKNLVWVAGSFPFSYGGESVWINVKQAAAAGSESQFDTVLARVARVLNAANLAIYPVDARGLLGPFGERAVASVGFIPRESVGRGPVGPRTTLATVYGVADVMRDLAERTGGRAFYSTNDIKGAIRKSVEDAELTYTIGYYPDHNQWDGKFRKIKVEVKRAGVELRYRQGYFAVPDRQLTALDYEKRLKDAASAPLNVTGLGVTMRLELQRTATTPVIEARVTVDARDLALRQEGGQWVGRLQLLMAQRGANGRTVSTKGEDLEVAVPAADYERVKQGGLTFTRRMTMDAQAVEVRVVVVDATNGTVGSVAAPLQKQGPVGSK